MSEAPKVAIGIPYYKTVDGPTLLSCMDLSARSAASVGMLPIGTSGCYVEDNRNGTVEYALATGIPFDWLLWIDTDGIFPGDALLRLLAHDVDIVGANYRQRTPPYKSAGVYEKPGSEMLPGLQPMIQMPTGLLLTRFEIYRKMPYPWFKPGTKHEARDDIWFCRQAQALGYKIWCDNDLTKEVQHIATQVIPWFQPEQLVRVEEGTSIDNQKAEAEANARAAKSRELYEAAIAAE